MSSIDVWNELSAFSSAAPVATVVVDGDEQTLENIYDDLRAHIPVIIVDVSERTHSSASQSLFYCQQDGGRFASFFKRWLLYTKRFDNRIEEAHQEPIDINHAAVEDLSGVPDQEAK